MEIQNQDPPPPSNPQDQSAVTLPLQPPLRPSPLSLDDIHIPAPALRFPKPQGSQVLAHWVSTSSSDIRQPPNMSDSDNGLGDSAYEIINGTESIETESQSSHMSESTSSLEIHRPDEVQSLDGSEDHYDSDDSADHSNASSIRYTAQMLGSPSTHTQTGGLEFSPYPAGAEVAAGSIAFQEEDSSVATGNISVKHTIREFTELETAAIAAQFKMRSPPKRLLATVRQTMSQAYLSTQEPLRVLYIGHPDTKREIVLKISNAIFASSQAMATGGSPGQQGGGVYNIVPISSFGPSPELDLMEASQCQIKVEHCTEAAALELESFMYSITIDNDSQQSYTTSTNSDGSCSVSPQWTLPHIAVFYCADEEEEQDKQTREAAWQFMKRHAVPSIFISQSETFSADPVVDWDEYINGDAVHVCVESRDPDMPIPRQRFPIDLATFLHIDARQMNRNLAHLAGMPLLLEKTDLLTPNPAKSNPSTRMREAWTWRSARELINFYTPILVVLMMLLSILLPASYNSHSTPLADHSLTNIIELPSTASLAQPTTLSSSTTLSSTAMSTSTSTATVVVNVPSTDTKTIDASQVLPTTSSLASALAFGRRLDRASYPLVDGVKTKTCSVRVLSPTEVLVVIPANQRASFFSKEPVTVDVTRGREPVTMMTSSVNEGIVIKIPSNEAHGTVNVSVVSLRKPKINETFGVDLGKAPATDGLGARLDMLLQGVANMVHSAVDDVSFPDLATIRNDVWAAWEQTKDTQVEGLKQGLSHMAKSAQRINEEAELALLHAQITSKLWWLQVRGKKEELAEYKRNATVFIQAKCADMLQKRLLEESKTSCKSGRETCSGRHADAKPDDGRGSRWKELIWGEPVW
ncbi:hypothetical protein QBC39DRAFT_164163 [Podospora conica]|nr:hypothetical protein QBC39DRAFT_164163 [Schizothecium conicum]